MEKVVSHEIGERPMSLLLSEANGLAVSLVEKLLANFCCVNIFAENLDDWKKLITNLNDNPFLRLESIEHLEKSARADYLIYFSSYFSKYKTSDIKRMLSEEELKIRKVLEMIGGFGKKIFILPLVYQGGECKFAELYNNLLSSPPDSSRMFIYLDELYGPRMLFTKRRFISNVLYQNVGGKEDLVESFRDFYYPCFIPAVVREITKAIFSGSFYGAGLRISSPKTPRSLLIGLLEDALGKQINVINREAEILLGSYEKEINLAPASKQNLQEVLDWASKKRDELLIEQNVELKGKERRLKVKKPGLLRKFSVEYKNALRRIRGLFVGRRRPLFKIMPPVFSGRQETSKMIKKPSGYKKTAAFLVALFVTVLLFPFVMMTTSLGTSYLGYRQTRAANFRNALVIFRFAKTVNSFSGAQFKLYSRVPFVGGFFTKMFKVSDVLDQVIKVETTASRIAQDGSRFFDLLLSGGKNDISYYSANLSMELESLYREVSFVQSEMVDLRNLGIGRFNTILEKADFERKREEIAAAKTIAEQMAEILGQSGERNYLVLFQNNMELRPTGGFIGSFAIVNFKGGSLGEMEVFDVYSADGQLKGHVEPPWQINKYLNQATWYLRDSNWDPDFETSAVRAEWFLDKEMDITVDGVIGIDLSFIKDLIGILGELDITEFNQRLNKSNFYEIAQYEAEKDFFPGSRKKANFLSAVSTKLMSEIRGIGKKQYYPLFLSVYKNLNEKHIQIFLHDAKAQTAFFRLNWSGSVNVPFCQSANCVADWVGLIEANLGVNKANYFVTRRMQITTTLEEGVINQNIAVYIKNTANPALADKGVYKTYLRVLAPRGSVFGGIQIDGKDAPDNLFLDYLKGRTEAGVWVVVNPQEEKKISISFREQGSISFDKNGEYHLYIRKQSGIDDLPTEGRIVFPNGLEIGSDSKGVLTSGSELGYNTDLAQDFSARIFW